MDCPNCLLVDMRLERVEDDTFYFRCKKCGKELIKTAEELAQEED